MKRGGNFVKLLPTLIEGGAELGIATASAQLILAQHSLLLGGNGEGFRTPKFYIFYCESVSPRL